MPMGQRELEQSWERSCAQASCWERRHPGSAAFSCFSHLNDLRGLSWPVDLTVDSSDRYLFFQRLVTDALGG